MGQIWRQSKVTQIFASVDRVIDQNWSKLSRSEDNEIYTIIKGAAESQSSETVKAQ